MSDANGAIATAESVETVPASEPAAKLVFTTDVDETAALAEYAQFAEQFSVMAKSFYATLKARKVQRAITDAQILVTDLAQHLGATAPAEVSRGIKSALDWATKNVSDLGTPGDLAKSIRTSLDYHEATRTISTQTAGQFRQLLADVNKAVEDLAKNPLPQLELSDQTVMVLEMRGSDGKSKTIGRSTTGDLAAMLKRVREQGGDDEDVRRLSKSVETMLVNGRKAGTHVSSRFTLKVTTFE